MNRDDIVKKIVINSLIIGLLFCPMALIHSAHANTVNQPIISFNSVPTQYQHHNQLKPIARRTASSAYVPKRTAVIRANHSNAKHIFHYRWHRKASYRPKIRYYHVPRRARRAHHYIPRINRYKYHHIYHRVNHKSYKKRTPKRKARIFIKRHLYVKHIRRARKHTYHHYSYKFPRRNALINPSTKGYRVVGNSTKPRYSIPYMHRLANLPFDNIQSLAVSPNGQWAYLCDGSDNNSGYDYLVRYDLYHHHIDKIGNWHFFGHGQSMTYYHNELLFLAKTYNNDGAYAGPMNSGEFINVSPKTLAPVNSSRMYFRTAPDRVGDVLAYDGHNLYDDDRVVNSPRKAYKNTSIVFFKVNLNHNQPTFYRYNRGLAHSAGYYVQAMAFNPANKRMYIESSRPDRLLSFPLARLQNSKLDYDDVHTINMHQRRETEGLAFDKYGHSFYVLGRPYRASLYEVWKKLA